MKAIRLTGTAMCALIAASAVVRAQSAPPIVVADSTRTKPGGIAAPSAALEQITVTAQKRAERLQSVPVSVTAFTKKQLENTQFRDVTDLSATVPNFQIEVSGSGPGASLISLRGLSFQDIEKSFEPPIGVVVDGVYLSTSTGQIAQAFDFNSVEVLAGPQGTLFGKNTTGGVINITRSKPDPSADHISGQFDVTAGNFGEHDGEIVVNAPLIKDVLALKLAAFSQNNTGTVYDSTLNQHVGARDYQSFSMGLDYRPNVDSDVYLIFDRTNDHSQLPPIFFAGTPNKLPLPVGKFVDGQDTPCLNPDLANACPNASGHSSDVATQDGVPKGVYNLYALTLNAYYNFENFKLVNVTGYRTSHEDTFADFDGTQYPLYNVQRPQYYRQFSQEDRFESEFSGPFNFVAGAYFFNSYYHLSETNALDYAAVLPVPVGAYPTDYFGSDVSQASWNEALFFQGTYDITPKLRLIFGARQSWDEKHLNFALDSGGTINTLGLPIPGQSVIKDHQWSQFTPKVGVQYTFNPNAMAYFTYSKGYNSGGFNGRAGASDLVGPYAPEQVHAFEAGTKTTWLNNRVRVNADVFWNIFNNAQEDIIQQINNQTSTTVANAANAVFRGIEIEAAGKPTPDWTLSANYGYLNAYYTAFTAALLPGPPTNNSNLTVRRTPPNTLGVTSDYVVPFNDSEVGFNVGLKYTGHQQFDLLNDPRGFQGPVTKLDMSLRYERKAGPIDWTLTAWVKNLTNETPNNTFVTGYQGSFVEFWTKDIGRTFGLTLRGKF